VRATAPVAPVRWTVLAHIKSIISIVGAQVFGFSLLFYLRPLVFLEVYLFNQQNVDIKFNCFLQDEEFDIHFLPGGTHVEIAEVDGYLNVLALAVTRVFEVFFEFTDKQSSVQPLVEFCVILDDEPCETLYESILGE